MLKLRLGAKLFRSRQRFGIVSLGFIKCNRKRHSPSEQKLKMRSPYTNKPFVVDEAQRSITVTGYGSGRNALQVYFY